MGVGVPGAWLISDDDACATRSRYAEYRTLKLDAVRQLATAIRQSPDPQMETVPKRRLN
jgi:hypothetical protein